MSEHDMVFGQKSTIRDMEKAVGNRSNNIASGTIEMWGLI